MTISEHDDMMGDGSNDPPRKLAVLGLPWETR